MPLIYTTSDREFAGRAIETLKSNGIEAYTTGEDRYSSYLTAAPRSYCIHIEVEADRARAGELLRQIGAAPEEPLRLPVGPWVKWAMLVLGICLGVIVLMTLT